MILILSTYWLKRLSQTKTNFGSRALRHSVTSPRTLWGPDINSTRFHKQPSQPSIATAVSSSATARTGCDLQLTTVASFATVTSSTSGSLHCGQTFTDKDTCHYGPTFALPVSHYHHRQVVIRPRKVIVGDLLREYLCFVAAVAHSDNGRFSLGFGGVLQECATRMGTSFA